MLNGRLLARRRLAVHTFSRSFISSLIMKGRVKDGHYEIIKDVTYVAISVINPVNHEAYRNIV